MGNFMQSNNSNYLSYNQNLSLINFIKNLTDIQNNILSKYSNDENSDINLSLEIVQIVVLFIYSFFILLFYIIYRSAKKKIQNEIC